MGFMCHRMVRMQETDATGVIYFTNQLKMALEAFEEFLAYKEFSLKSMIQDKKFLFPIVHAEADYFKPITIGEKVTIILKVPNIGNHSFTHCAEFKKEGKEIGMTHIVHAIYSNEKGKTIPIPQAFKNILSTLSTDPSVGPIES